MFIIDERAASAVAGRTSRGVTPGLTNRRMKADIFLDFTSLLDWTADVVPWSCDVSNLPARERHRTGKTLQVALSGLLLIML